MQKLLLLLTLFISCELMASDLDLNEQAIREFEPVSHLIVTGQLTAIRKIAFFDDDSGAFIGHTEEEAAKAIHPNAFAMAVYCADLKVNSVLSNQTNQQKVEKLSIIWTGTTAIVPSAGSSSMCPPVSHHAQDKNERLWFLKRTGTWRSLVDVDPNKAALTEEVLAKVEAEKREALKKLPDPFQEGTSDQK